MARLESICSSSRVGEHLLLVGSVWWNVAKRRLIHGVHVSKGGIKRPWRSTKGRDVKEHRLHGRQEGQAIVVGWWRAKTERKKDVLCYCIAYKPHARGSNLDYIESLYSDSLLGSRERCKSGN